jgi:RNA polymerase sigma factor (sigma-70 family)
MSATTQATYQSRRGARTVDPESCVPRKPASDLEDTFDLLARVRADDQSAWEALLTRYLRPLKRIAHRHRLPCYARSVSETDDLVQDALLKTIGRLRHFECRNRGALLAYLRQVVINRVVDEARRCARHGRSALFDDEHPGSGPSPLESVLDKEEMERYRDALRRLKPRDRQLIVLRLQHHLTYEEVATRLDIASPAAARMASTRAVLRLASVLKHG